MQAVRGARHSAGCERVPTCFLGREPTVQTVRGARHSAGCERVPTCFLGREPTVQAVRGGQRRHQRAQALDGGLLASCLHEG